MLFEQVSVFPAELAAAPTVAVIDWTPLGAFHVHSSAAGWPALELMVRFNEAVPPAAALVDPRDSVALCATNTAAGASQAVKSSLQALPIILHAL